MNFRRGSCSAFSLRVEECEFDDKLDGRKHPNSSILWAKRTFTWFGPEILIGGSLKECTLPNGHGCHKEEGDKAYPEQGDL